MCHFSTDRLLTGKLVTYNMTFPFQAKKPLMEKMRRARINDSLNEMKGLVLDLLHKDVSFCFLSVVKQNQLWAEVSLP